MSDDGLLETGAEVELISLVVPVYNERESLEALYQEIVAATQSAKLTFDLIFVDDGSKDGSWDIICKLSAQDPRVRGIRFRRNFGKAAALSAGFRAVRGSITITLDADLQDDPKEIPRFLDAIHSGRDVVSGWKKIRHDPWHKVFPSRVFNTMVSWLTGVHLHDHNCGMKAYRSEVFREVRLYGEMHRFIPVLAAARGFRIGELVIQHRPRKFGHSKYGVRRFVKGFLDLLTVKFLTSFSHRPQHLLGSTGLFSFLLGIGALGYLALTWVIRQIEPTADIPPIHERALPIYALGAMLLGVQLLSLGFLAELMTANSTREIDQYSIAEQTLPHSPGGVS